MFVPLDVNVSADPNPPGDGVTKYNFYLNGQPAGNATTPLGKVTVPTEGIHKFGISAVNQWGESAVTEVTEHITLASAPTGVKVVKAP